MAQGVAWMARELGVPATDHRAPQLLGRPSSLRSSGSAAASSTSRGTSGGPRWRRAEWTASTGTSSTRSATSAVMAGNGTIGLELAEDLDEFDAVVIPWGGGGLTTGIASALAALRPDARVVVVRAGDRRARCRSGRERPRTRAGRVHAVVHRRRRIGRPAPGHVGTRRAARRRGVRDPARGGSCGRARAGRARADRRRGCGRAGSRGRARGQRRQPAASSASSAAGTSTPPASPRSSTAAFPTSRSAPVRAPREPLSGGSDTRPRART